MGIIRWIFNHVLRKKIKNSEDFKQAVKETDVAMANLQRTIQDAEKNGTIIPDELKKFAGMEILKEDKIIKQ